MIACPFRYADGKACTGHLVRIERYNVIACWNFNASTDDWELGVYDEGSHFHLFCSEKADHAGATGQVLWPMKSWGPDLPEDIRRIVYPSE